VPDEPTSIQAQLRLAQQHAHSVDAERAELESQLLTEVRRLCQITIADSVRVQAVEQARDTLAVIDSITGTDPLPGDAAWHSVWLHGNWRWLTKNMTTPEREHAADAVARYGQHLDTLDGCDRFEEPEGLRWWRD
jgi:plasmid stability protein